MEIRYAVSHAAKNALIWLQKQKNLELNIGGPQTINLGHFLQQSTGNKKKINNRNEELIKL